MRVVMSGYCEVYLDGDPLPEWFQKQVLDELTVDNPDWKTAHKAGRSTRGIPEDLHLYDLSDDGQVYYLPRMAPCLTALEGIDSTDERVRKRVVMPESQFVPREPEQEEAIAAAVEALERLGGAVVVSGTGTGKTIMGVEVGIRRGLRTLILVHKDKLAEQFHEAVQILLPGEKVGHIQGDDFSLGTRFTTASIQTLLAASRRDSWDDSFLRYFGLVIADEVHRHSAAEWRRAISMFPAAERLGLTATDERADKLECVYQWNIGPICYRDEEVPLTPRLQMLNPGILIPMEEYTTWKCSTCGERVYRDAETQVWCCLNKACRGPKPGVNNSRLISVLSENRERNRWLYSLIVRAIRGGRFVMGLSERTDQLDKFVLMLRREFGDDQIGAYYGTASSKRKKLAMAEEAKKPHLMATYKKAGEGFSEDRLDVLVMLTPNTRPIQPVGRILRPRAGKPQPVVIDPWDQSVPTLDGYGHARRRHYTKMGWL